MTALDERGAGEFAAPGFGTPGFGDDDSDDLRCRYGRSSSAVLARSCTALRRLDPDHPRVYAVADMADQGKRRWWALASGATTDRFDQLYRRALLDHPDKATALEQVATALIHAVVGRVVALLALEGRAWDPGIDNLWIHLDSDVGIDWAGVTDPTLRVIAGDAESSASAVVTMPCEAALVMWTAHRSLTSLNEVFDALTALGPLDARRFWRLVGEAIVGASSFVPVLGGGDHSAGWRRGQALLDAFVSLGRPVRGGGHRSHTSRIERRDLGQAFLYSA